MELESNPDRPNDAIQDSGDDGASRKRRGKRGWLRGHGRRIVVYTFLLISLSLVLTDYLLESVGVPESMKDAIERSIRDRGLDISFDDARCGVIGGVALTNFKLRDPGYDGHVIFSAEKFSFSLVFLLPFTKDLAASNGFEVKNGRISVPLFPETGEEGLSDAFEVEDLNASGMITENGLNINSLSGKLGPFSFTMAGSLKNVLRLKSKERNDKRRFSMAPLIENIPYHIRAKVHRAYSDFASPGFFDDKPSCDAMFNIDALRPEDTVLMAYMELPGFHYSGLEVASASARILFDDYKLEVREMKARLSNGSELGMDGKYDATRDRLSVRLSGSLRRDDAMSILKHVAPDAVGVVKLGAEPVSFSANLRDFSFVSLRLEGDAKIKIPSAEVKGLAIRSLVMDAGFTEDAVKIRHFSFDTVVNHVEGGGVFYPEFQSIDGEAWCYGPPLFVIPFLEGVSKKNAAEFFGRFTYPKDKKKVRLDASVHFSWYDKQRYFIYGTVAIDAPFKYYSVGFDKGTAAVAFDDYNLFVVPEMSLHQRNGRAELSVVYEENDGAGYSVESPSFVSSKGPCQRALIELRSDIPGKDVLGCVLPNVKPAALDLSVKANLAAAGSIDLLHDEKTDFSIDVIDSRMGWNDIPLEHLNCDLRFQGVKMIVEGAEAKVRGGDLKMDLTCDFSDGSGNFDLNLADADFPALAKRLGWKMKSEKGKISVKAKAKYSDGGKKGTLMTGKGNMAIRGADLWEVPFVSHLSRILAPMVKGDMGKISALDADFEFKGDHLETKNAKSDGDVVSLYAEGVYFWDSGDFNFDIRARILKRMLPFEWASKIFSPFAALFKTSVIRRGGRVQWKKPMLMGRFLDRAGKLTDPNL